MSRRHSAATKLISPQAYLRRIRCAQSNFTAIDEKKDGLKCKGVAVIVLAVASYSHCPDPDRPTRFHRHHRRCHGHFRRIPPTSSPGRAKARPRRTAPRGMLPAARRRPPGRLRRGPQRRVSAPRGAPCRCASSRPCSAPAPWPPAAPADPPPPRDSDRTRAISVRLQGAGTLAARRRGPQPSSRLRAPRLRRLKHHRPSR